MPDIHNSSLHDYLRFYTDQAENVTFVDLDETTAFQMDSSRTFSLLELKDIINNNANHLIALWSKKEDVAQDLEVEDV